MILNHINLTRTLEGGGTLTAPLVPWNSSGVFVYSTIGVLVAAYFPFAIFCWITPIIVAIMGYTKWGMHKIEELQQDEPNDQQ